jgi:hypothetical protein
MQEIAILNALDVENLDRRATAATAETHLGSLLLGVTTFATFVLLFALALLR